MKCSTNWWYIGKIFLWVGSQKHSLHCVLEKCFSLRCLIQNLCLMIFPHGIQRFSVLSLFICLLGWKLKLFIGYATTKQDEIRPLLWVHEFWFRFVCFFFAVFKMFNRRGESVCLEVTWTHINFDDVFFHEMFNKFVKLGESDYSVWCAAFAFIETVDM